MRFFLDAADDALQFVVPPGDCEATVAEFAKNGLVDAYVDGSCDTDAVLLYTGIPEIIANPDLRQVDGETRLFGVLHRTADICPRPVTVTVCPSLHPQPATITAVTAATARRRAGHTQRGRSPLLLRLRFTGRRGWRLDRRLGVERARVGHHVLHRRLGLQPRRHP